MAASGSPPRRKAKIERPEKPSGNVSKTALKESKSKSVGPRARALDQVKKHAPEHLDAAKKTKWVVELVLGILADHDAASESAQAVHAVELEAAAKARQASEETSAVRQLLASAQAEVEAAKVALEQAEMSAVVAATECMNMQKVAQAGSQGDKKARRVLSLRAHHLKENLLKAKTDLRAQKAACRHQAYKLEVMSKDHEVAAAAANQLTEQPAVQQLAAKQALKQSKSQSRLYQSKAVHESEAAVLIPAVQASAAGKAPKQQATVVSPPASPARRILVNESPAKMAQVAAEMLHDKAGEVRGACSL
ncbi:hypothetical protein ABBQ32_005933 [Trebouxia sp. C0010 RCD-2024]